MIPRPTHPSDDAHGPGDAGIAELAPVIATIEELVEGIARELSASLTPHTSLREDSAPTSVVTTTLVHDLDAAEARIRELREQLWYAQAATHSVDDFARPPSDRQHANLERYRELEPLFMRLESQIRHARLDQLRREERDVVDPLPMRSPWLPSDTDPTRRTKPEVASTTDVVNVGLGATEHRPRWRWMGAVAASLVAALVGGWLVIQGTTPRLVSEEARGGRLETDIAPPLVPAVAEPTTGQSSAAEVSERPPAGESVASSPFVTDASGSVPARPRSLQDDGPSALPAVGPARPERLSASRRAESAAATSPGDARGRDALEPTGRQEAVDPAAGAPQSPAQASREDAVGSPVAPLEGGTPARPAATPVPDAVNASPAEVIARATAVPTPSEDVARTAPVAEARAATLAPPTTESMPLSRPAAVLTSVQPRVLVEMTSADMAAGVEVRVRVDRSGRAADVRAVSGPVALRAPAEDTVRRWTFSPAIQDGEPVDGELRVTLTFGATPRNLRLPRRSP